MASRLIELFENEKIRKKINERLPFLFQIAEKESSRAGKIGMEVGSLREKMLIALLISEFGEENVDTNIPITEAEVDTRLFGQPISIKTKSNAGFAGVKLVWTVDAEMSKRFREEYEPTCDILFVHIIWGSGGGLYYIPVEVQKDVFAEMGRDSYIKLPALATNPRGAEVAAKALEEMVKHKDTKVIDIEWNKVKLDYDPYKRWVDYWKET